MSTEFTLEAEVLLMSTKFTLEAPHGGDSNE